MLANLIVIFFFFFLREIVYFKRVEIPTDGLGKDIFAHLDTTNLIWNDWMI